jgi:hypothetical protein
MKVRELQNRVRQFNSGRGLQFHFIDFATFLVRGGFRQNRPVVLVRLISRDRFPSSGRWRITA